MTMPTTNDTTHTELLKLVRYAARTADVATTKPAARMKWALGRSTT
jgi:hypothetical protein